MNHTDIVFDGPPSHESGRFVEVEDATGKSIRFGEWIARPDGYWALRIEASHHEIAAARDLLAALLDIMNAPWRPEGMREDHADAARAAIARAIGDAP